MKKISFFGLLLLGTNDKFGHADRCSEVCQNIKDGLVLTEICSKEMKLFPHPKVGKFCIDGAARAYHDVCLEFCESALVAGTNLDRHRFKDRATEACKHAKKILPRPTFMRSCMNGYKKAASSVIAQVTKALDMTMEVASQTSALSSDETSASLTDSVEASTLTKIGSSFSGFEGGNSISLQEIELDEASSANAHSSSDIDEEVVDTFTHPDNDSFSMVIHLGDREVEFNVDADENVEKAIIEFCLMYMSQAHDECVEHVSETVEAYFSAES